MPSGFYAASFCPSVALRGGSFLQGLFGGFEGLAVIGVHIATWGILPVLETAMWCRVALLPLE